ncbi:hypothetical protein F4774DRAFT_376656 [Daldinia eschscholtzii]|nr:hypothetical protein F4774DRAFT_376656 [Daldinia eschscholtzii]
MILVEFPYSILNCYPVVLYNITTMDTMYHDPSPEVAASMEASATLSMRIMEGIIALIGVCWFFLAVFFVYNFSRPLGIVDTENSTEPHIVDEGTEKKWWVDNSDAV